MIHHHHYPLQCNGRDDDNDDDDDDDAVRVKGSATPTVLRRMAHVGRVVRIGETAWVRVDNKARKRKQDGVVTAAAAAAVWRLVVVEVVAVAVVEVTVLVTARLLHRVCGRDVTMECPVWTAMSRMTDTAAGGAKTEANNPVPNNKHKAVRCDNNPECVACPGSVDRMVLIMVG